MALHTLQIVDSIAASPTVLLDLNDGTTWRCTNFDAAPPRLRRAMSENAMRDGVFVSSSAYGPRELALTLAVVSSTQDANASQLQALARVLDRDDVYLKWQPAGATKPVFFKLFRSDFESLAELRGQAAAREGVVRLLAEPFALGLRETLGPYTVTNNPAAGSNGCYFDVTGVIGDVPAPAVIVDDTALRGNGWLAVRQHGTPSDLIFFKQAESCTLGTNTTNPGGGPDATMSGTGANNYVTCSFTSATMAARISWDLSADFTTTAQREAIRGRYRVIIAYKRGTGSGDVLVRATVDGGATGASFPITSPAGSDRFYLDLGVLSLTAPEPARLEAGGVRAMQPGILRIEAERTGGGAEEIHFDAIFIIPADESMLMWSLIEDQTTSIAGVFDGASESVYVTSDAGPFAGYVVAPAVVVGSIAAAGGFPSLVPNQTNRFYYLTERRLSPADRGAQVGLTGAISAYYHPRYLYVRPAAS